MLAPDGRVRHQPIGNEVSTRRQDDRDRGCRILRGEPTRRPRGDDYVNLQPDELGGERREALRLPVGPAVLDNDVAPFRVPEFPESESKRLIERGRPRSLDEITDHRNLPRLLPFGGERRRQLPKRDPAEEGAPVDH